MQISGIELDLEMLRPRHRLLVFGHNCLLKDFILILIHIFFFEKNRQNCTAFIKNILVYYLLINTLKLSISEAQI